MRTFGWQNKSKGKNTMHLKNYDSWINNTLEYVHTLHRNLPGKHTYCRELWHLNKPKQTVSQALTGSTGPKTLVSSPFEQMFCSIFTHFLELLNLKSPWYENWWKLESASFGISGNTGKLHEAWQLVSSSFLKNVGSRQSWSSPVYFLHNFWKNPNTCNKINMWLFQTILEKKINLVVFFLPSLKKSINQ